MGSAYVADGVAMSVRTKWIVRTVLLLALATGAFFFWKGAQPPSFDEQYQGLMASTPVANTQFPFDRMSSPQSFAEATSEERAYIYGYFDGPGERNMIIYQLFESAAVAEEVFLAQRAEFEENPPGYKFSDQGGLWTEVDYRVTAPGYANYSSLKDNVIIQGESWRRNEGAVDDATLEQRAFGMMRTAVKHYLGLFGN